MNQGNSLNGLVAVVTGGASGIGRTCALLLAAHGARVAVLDVASADDLELAQWRVSVTDSDALQLAIDEVAEQFGGLDIVVNCAAVAAQGTIADNSDEEWQWAFDVNVTGIARVMRAALPHLRRSEAASVVNIGSIAATAGLPSRALYSATKGAVLALTKAMAADHLAEGIRVNCVHPGTADTPWVQRLLDKAPDPAAERAALEARQPHGRLVAASEVAGAVLYLASPGAGSTTGVDLAVDGGMQALRLRR